MMMMKAEQAVSVDPPHHDSVSEHQTFRKSVISFTTGCVSSQTARIPSAVLSIGDSDFPDSSLLKPPFFEIRIAHPRHQIRCLVEVRLEDPASFTMIVICT